MREEARSLRLNPPIRSGTIPIGAAASLGYENLKTTIVYSRPGEAELQEAVDRMEVALPVEGFLIQRFGSKTTGTPC